MENQAEPPSPLDSDMEDEEGALPVSSSAKTETNANHLDEENVTQSQLKSAPVTISSTFHNANRQKRSKKSIPKDLYAKIEQSRDKLFFIAYATPDQSEEVKWYLVRVDLETCNEVAQDCKTSGKYYVEFYTKALADQSKLDSESRWWLIWNTFYFKRGEMIIGSTREHDPNSKWALNRRLADHPKKRNQDSEDCGYATWVGFGPNLEKFTTYSDIVDLSNPNIRLTGPFNFELVQAKYIETEGDLGNVSPNDIFVRDRVPMSRWIELVQALDNRGGSEIVKPIIEGKKQKRKSLDDIDEKKAGKLPRDDKKQTKSQPACQLCGKVDLGKEALLFAAKSCLPALCVHKKCGLQAKDAPSGRKIVTTRDVIELVEKSVKDVRQASASDGELYCVLEEFRAKLNRNLDSMAQQMSGTKVASTNRSALGTGLPNVLPESEFTTIELQNMPMVFAYHVRSDDPSGLSEQNAKIAKLDHDVARRREKRLANQYSEESKKTYSNNTTKSRSETKPTKPAGKAEKLVADAKQAICSPFDDPSGLGQVNETIGLLARISAERSREKSRASADSGSSDQPPHKMARTTSSGDFSNKSNPDGKTRARKAKRNDTAVVYDGPLLSLPAEPAGPFLNIPDFNLDGWTVRTKSRSSDSESTPRSRHVDRYFFSPGGRKFRSKPEVVRFLECLKEAQGNEARASEIFAGGVSAEREEETFSRESDRNSGVENEDGSTFI